MIKIFLVLLVSFSYPIFCHGQKIENFQVIDKGANVSDVLFGKGNYLFVLSYDGQVKKLYTDSITPSHSFNVKATSIGISNTADTLALGTSDGNLLLFNNQEQVKNFKAHNHLISHITFSPSNRYLATSSTDSTIKIWSAKTYELVQEINTRKDRITDIKFSLDDAFLVYSTHKGKIVVWNLEGKNLSATHQISKNWIRNIAICPDSIKFAVCGNDRKITILSFTNKEVYPLKESHKNIISDIQFINKDYLLSIGHDHLVSMNNINLPDEKAEVKHFKGYARYQRSLYDLSGDHYLSALCLSNDQKAVAVSSYGKGIALTDYFHKILENPHVVTIKELDNKNLHIIGINPEFVVKNNTGILKGRITRPDEIKNAWLYFVKDDKRIKIKVEKNGEFKLQAGVYEGITEYAIIVEDWDKNLDTVHYSFTMKKSE